MTETTENDPATTIPQSATPALPTSPPVVCDLTGAPDSGEERLLEYARLLDTAYLSRERTEKAMRWWLRAGEGIEAWTRDLAARENACCAFMTTTVTLVGDQVLWEATTIDDPAARAVLDLMYELPEQRWSGADEVFDRFVATTGVPIVTTDGSATRPATPDEIRSGPTTGSGRPRAPQRFRTPRDA